MVQLNLVLDAGYAADQAGTPGHRRAGHGHARRRHGKRTALQISDELAMLGASLGTGSDLDISFVSLSTLKEKLDAALDIYADVILDPAFPEADFQRLQKQQLARSSRRRARPSAWPCGSCPGCSTAPATPTATPSPAPATRPPWPS